MWGMVMQYFFGLFITLLKSTCGVLVLAFFIACCCVPSKEVITASQRLKANIVEFLSHCVLFTFVLDKHSVRFLGHYERQRGKVTKPTGRVVEGAKSDHNLEILANYTEEIQKQRYEKV